MNLRLNSRLGTYILLLFLLTTGCKKKPSDTVATHLEKAMDDYLQKGLAASNSKLQFHIEDVSYFRIGEWYRCQFKVKLHRENGTDTTGIIQGKISTDYSTVIK